MAKYPNKIVKNVSSPTNEKDYINAYKSLVPSSNKKDRYDIAAVKAKDGTRGHVLLDQSINRSKDDQYHHGKQFVSNDELRKHMKSK